MRKVLLAAAAAIAVTPACAQPAVQATAVPGAPKLIVALSIDQFSADLYDEYRPVLLGGIGRLSQGTVFRNGYQSHNATETCPGHSTIMTGSRPSRTGIIANYWYDQSQTRSDKGVYCSEDERVAGSSSTAYSVSPYHLRVPTLGDLLKNAQSGSRNVAVAGKDRSAVMMSGHHADQRWYWDGKTFVTDMTGVVMPRSVAAAKQAVSNAVAQDRPALELPALCQPKATAIPIEGGGAPVGANRFGRKAGDLKNFRASPEFDGATLALAASLIEEMQLGRGASTDVISIGLSGTDVIGHTYGTEGAEMCLQLFSIDRDLGDFFRLLDSKGIDYMVVLTADHGGQDIPERKRLHGTPGAARVDAKLTAKDVGAAVAAQLGLKGPVLYGDGSFGDMYVDRALSPADQARAKAAAIAAFKAHPQVETVFTREQLAAAASPTSPPNEWSLIDKARASFDPERSGDFIVLLKRDVNPVAVTTSYVATHGSPWDYDRRVPILFWRRGMSQNLRNDSIETVDIMPTLAAAIGLAVDQKSIDGECLTGVQGVNCPAR
ncbi:alkaline phosphatase family protein [Sphingomonas sp. NSE70-1]|uniref:Alkaline phosphatase n=1 Tax=Sphingomonas caseinilyticus TaxID=2908205 RepID=A0ABT0RRV6_9SPHN|nr:alkaline phosphatase family protein [Sphingomonas caseinilyticus]MCL6697410.1 alkaline phosphatase family protein [Sphingomonas caseinilyticus]